MKECTYKVMVRKTVQAKQFEPTVIELSTEGACLESERNQKYDEAFNEIKTKMNQLFGGGPAAGGCLG